METKHKITLEKNKVELTISDMRDKDTRGAGHDRQGRAAASPKLESKIVSAKKKTAHHQHHNQQEHNNKKNNNDDRSICWQHKTDRRTTTTAATTTTTAILSVRCSANNNNQIGVCSTPPTTPEKSRSSCFFIFLKSKCFGELATPSPLSHMCPPPRSCCPLLDLFSSFADPLHKDSSGERKALCICIERISVLLLPPCRTCPRRPAPPRSPRRSSPPGTCAATSVRCSFSCPGCC